MPESGLDLALKAAPARQPRHVVIETSRLKLFGAGEWYARKHGMGEGQRRTWRHLARRQGEVVVKRQVPDRTAAFGMPSSERISAG